jgi:hypothetical protein
MQIEMESGIHILKDGIRWLACGLVETEKGIMLSIVEVCDLGPNGWMG